MTTPLAIPIVTYHAVGDLPSPLWTPRKVFEAQLDAFHRDGWVSVTLAQVLAWLGGQGSLPERPVVFTFDDGYASVYEAALPALAERGYGGTVFLISDYCGQDNRWPDQPAGVPVSSLLNWEQIAEMAQAGWEIGVHTRTHHSLPTLTPSEAEDEVLRSREHIEQQLGQPARIFCYPYGATDRKSLELIRHHFDGAAGTQLGLAGPVSDAYLLPRIDAYYLDPWWIPRLQGSLFRQYLQARQTLRTLRRAFKPDWGAVAAGGEKP